MAFCTLVMEFCDFNNIAVMKPMFCRFRFIQILRLDRGQEFNCQNQETKKSLCAHMAARALLLSVQANGGQVGRLCPERLESRRVFLCIGNPAVKASKMQWIWQSVSLMGIHICTWKHRDVLKRQRKHTKDKAREAMSGTSVDDCNTLQD